MNVKEIVVSYLQSHGCDGLVSDFGECGCGVGDLAPCNSDPLSCVPAVFDPKTGDYVVKSDNKTEE